MAYCGVYVFLLAQLLPLSLGAGILEVKLLSYVNQGWRDIDGRCCGGDQSSDHQSPCNTQCTPYFRICLKQWQNPVQPEAPCYFGSRVTGVFTTNSVSNSPTSSGNILRIDLAHADGFSEPMKFPFSFNWPGTMSLIVEAFHGTTNGSGKPPSPDLQSSSSSSISSGKQLLLRIAELRILPISPEWTMESHSNNHSQLELQYRVVCEQHFYGKDCTKYCRPRDDEYGHHVCTENGAKHCMTGWTGSICNKAICAPGCHPTNGHCTVPGECTCYLGYQGQLCDHCIRYPGCMHGTCRRPFECQCDEGWGGLFCNQDLNFCTHHKPCQNGATCTNTGSGHYTCQCRTGFAGVNCENRVETCDQSPCLNGGTCTQSASNYTCQCPAGYSGRHCQSNARTCQDQPCENGASCTDTADGYRCMCPPGFGGANCDMERDECAERNPCRNGGTCITRRVTSPTSLSSPSFYECSCPTGFTGPNCETNYNDCTLQPCLNDGTCEDLVGAFKCVCTPGFIGMLCQHNIDDCLTRPCANGGTCFDLVNDFRCMCRPGFRGKDCSIDINECESNPCRNGGTCTDSIDAYQCRCPACFAGVNCEQRNDDCVASLDAWTRPDLIIAYNVSGLPLPTVFHVGLASGHSDPTASYSNVSQSILTVGVPILVVLALIMVALIVVVTYLYRKTKRQSSSFSSSKQTIDTSGSSADLESCKRQNDWNERRVYNNTMLDPNRPAKTDNRVLESVHYLKTVYDDNNNSNNNNNASSIRVSSKTDKRSLDNPGNPKIPHDDGLAMVGHHQDLFVRSRPPSSVDRV